MRAADGEVEYALLAVEPGVDQDVLGRWSRAQRVAVAARRGSEERYVFCGCPLEVEWQIGAERAPREQVLLKAEGLAAALRRCSDLVIVGRFGRTRQAWSADGDTNVVGQVSGLECLYGPDGQLNCAARPDHGDTA